MHLQEGRGTNMKCASSIKGTNKQKTCMFIKDEGK